MSRYDYKELLKKAMKTRSFEDCRALAEWMDIYCIMDWNGFCYKLDDGKELYPIYEQTSYGHKIVGYEIR